MHTCFQRPKIIAFFKNPIKTSIECHEITLNWIKTELNPEKFRLKQRFVTNWSNCINSIRFTVFCEQSLLSHHEYEHISHRTSEELKVKFSRCNCQTISSYSSSVSFWICKLLLCVCFFVFFFLSFALPLPPSLCAVCQPHRRWGPSHWICLVFVQAYGGSQVVIRTSNNKLPRFCFIVGFLLFCELHGPTDIWHNIYVAVTPWSGHMHIFDCV